MPTTLLPEIPACPNFPSGMPRQRFELHSAIWSGERIELPIEGRLRSIIGWDDGEPAAVHAVRATWLPPTPEEVAWGRFPQQSLTAADDPACYNMLYACKGAIRGIRWHGIPKEEWRPLKDGFERAQGR